jgi:chromosome segregation ATPase
MSDTSVQQWLVVAAAFLTGLLTKWLLDLFFLRSGIFETRAQLAAREQQLTEARHEQARTSEALKNRLIELDATTKAKLAAEGLAARRSKEIEVLNSTAGELRRKLESATEAVARLESDLDRTTRQLDESRSAEASLRSESLGLRLDQSISAATLAGQEDSLQELRGIRLSLIEERDAVVARCLGAELSLEAQRSVNEGLANALQARDTMLAGLRSQLESLESERQSVAGLLASRDGEVERLSQTATQLDALRLQHAATEMDLARARTELESATRVRNDAQATLRRREAELAESERRATEYQAAFDDAARENARLGQELAKSEALATANGGSVKSAEAARKDLEQRLAATVLEMESLHGRLREAEAGGSDGRDRLASAELALTEARAAKTALEGELEAVSQSHSRLESQLVELRPNAARADDLAERLGQLEAELASLRGTPAGSGRSDIDALLNDLDQVTRERNELAAELALHRKSGNPES